MTQPTVSKHRRKYSSPKDRLQSHQVHLTMLQYYTCMQCTQNNTYPFPQINIIGAMVTVWGVRGKIIRFVLCNIVRNNCAQCNEHTYNRPNSSLDWVLSHTCFSNGRVKRRSHRTRHRTTPYGAVRCLELRCSIALYVNETCLT